MDFLKDKRSHTQGGTKHIINPQHRREKEKTNNIKNTKNANNRTKNISL